MPAGMKIAVVGECMVTRPFAIHREEDFLKIRELISGADVCYGHLEMNFGRFEDVYPVRGNWVGSFMLADSRIAKDLKWLGIDMMSLANNHSCDYGSDAVISTIEACADAGLVTAGTGETLEKAQAPAYFENAGKKMSLVAAATGNPVNEWASPKDEGPRHRAGVNPLSVSMKFHVPKETAQILKTIGNKFDILENKENGFSLHTTSALTACGDGWFEESDRYYMDSECSKDDLERNLEQIRCAASNSDLVMVAHHSNSAEDGIRVTPPKYAVEFAHAAIDAGADIYFGHAWHKMLGVEIYKGKPIFYGLGNFFMQSHFVKRLPYDCFEARNVDSSKMKGKPSENPHPGIKQPSLDISLTSTVIELEFSEEKEVKTIKFYPVELGVDLNTEDNQISRYTGNRNAEGRPMLAHGNGARKILERLSELSKPFGTEIIIDGEVGIWQAETKKEQSDAGIK